MSVIVKQPAPAYSTVPEASDVELLRRLNSIEANDDFLLFCSLHPEFCRKVKWETLFRDKYPLESAAADALRLDEEAAFVDLYAYVMHFRHVLSTKDISTRPAKLLEAEHPVAWVIHAWRTREALLQSISGDAQKTVARLAPHLPAQDRIDGLLYARSVRMAELLVGNLSVDGKEWTVVLHELAAIAAEARMGSEDAAKDARADILLLLLELGVEFSAAELLEDALEAELLPVVRYLTRSRKMAAAAARFAVEYGRTRLLETLLLEGIVQGDDLERALRLVSEGALSRVIRAGAPIGDPAHLFFHITSRRYYAALHALMRRLKNKGRLGDAPSLEAVFGDMRRHDAPKLVALLAFASDEEVQHALKHALILGHNTVVRECILEKQRRGL